MLQDHPALRSDNADTSAAAWVRHCRMWQPAISARRPRRRIYWLSVPLDGGHRRALDTVAGRDKDTDAALSDYRERAAELVRALPGVFFPKPVSAEQIWRLRNYIASRGVWRQPLPAQRYDPHARLPGSVFTAVHFDPSAAQLRGRRWRAARTDTDVFVRTFRDAADGVPDSYQALVPLDSFPDTGIAWPRATIFALDDLTGPDTTLEDDPHHIHLRRRGGVDGAERQSPASATSTASAAATPIPTTSWSANWRRERSWPPSSNAGPPNAASTRASSSPQPLTTPTP
jgi:hypothetical protein